MNTKQSVPLFVTLAPAIAAIAPPLLVGGAAFLLLQWLFSGDDETKPETLPANTETETGRKQTEIIQKTIEFRRIPPETVVKSVLVPVASVSVTLASPPPPAPAVLKALLPPASVVLPVINAEAKPAKLLPIKKRVVSRNDMANIFQKGARALNRTEAVAALKKLGFGKTTAYAALSTNGRFASWLQFAPDGIIIWKDI